MQYEGSGVVGTVAVNLLLILLLVQIARKRRADCDWDREKINRRLWLGIVGVAAVQIGGAYLMLETGHGLGILGAIQWPCIYWIALGVYRKCDLRQEQGPRPKFNNPNELEGLAQRTISECNQLGPDAVPQPKRDTLAFQNRNELDEFILPPLASATAPITAFSSPAVKSSYIVRHWRGRLSLGVSYWVNQVLLSAVIAALAVTLSSALAASDSPKALGIGAIALWALAFVLTPWQLVGVWRSAIRHTSRNGSPIWAMLAKLGVVLGLIQALFVFVTSAVPQVSEYWEIASGHDPLGNYQLRVLRDASELELSGTIGFGLTEDVNKILKAHPTITMIHLNSAGGRVWEARKLGDLIEATGLSTYTATGCSSACIIPFAAGRQRLISRTASLGFHQYTFPGTLPSDFAPEYEKDKRYLVSRGVSPIFVDRAFSTPNSELWRPTHRELFEAGMVTGYANSDDVGLSGIKISEMGTFEEKLLQNPLYAALKNYEPEIYQSVLAELKSGMLRGISQAELRSKTLPLIHKVYERRLPYASASALRRCLQLLVDQMEAARRVNPEVCYDFLFPKPGETNHAVEYLPNDLVIREMTVMAEVIRSAATSPRKPPTEKEIESQLFRIVMQLSAAFGDDALLLTAPIQSNVDKARICEMSLVFYQKILELPDRQAAPLVRYLFANGNAGL